MTERELDALHARFLAAAGPLPPPVAAAVASARAIADGLPAGAPRDAAGEVFAGAALAALAAAGRMRPDQVEELLGAARDLAGADPLRSALLALGDPAALQASLDIALRAHVTLLSGACGLAAVAAWRVVPDGAMAPVAASVPSAFQATRATVAQAFCRDAADLPLAVVRDGDEPFAVIAWSAPPAAARTTRMLAERSAASLAITAERVGLSQTEIAHHAGLARDAKRRLTRVALDLHDGPLQNLALMRHEIAGARGRLLHLGPAGERVVAQLDDVLAIADATATDLRELATSMSSSSLVQRPFDEALRGVARGFALRSGLEPAVTLSGDVHGLTAMERVALLRVVGEALANAREHSGAQNVVLKVAVSATEIEAVVSDDGCGFDLAHALPEAARRGSMGLLGMIERVRLMNGTWDVESAVGEGTRIVVRLDRFFPAVPAADQPAA